MKTAVIYWSGTGNTETMANAVAEGMKEAGAEVTMLTPEQVQPAALSGFGAIALGCPAMGSEVLEEMDFQPMFDGCKNAIGSKRVALFGCGDSASYPDSFCDALAEIRDGLEATGCTFVGALDAAEYDGCASRICRDGKVIGLAVDDGASEAVNDARMEKWIAAVGF